MNTPISPGPRPTVGRVAHRYMFPFNLPACCCCCFFCSPLSSKGRDDEPLEFLYPASKRQLFRAAATASLLRLSFLTSSRNRSCCLRSLPFAGDTEVARCKRSSALWKCMQQRVGGGAGRGGTRRLGVAGQFRAGTTVDSHCASSAVCRMVAVLLRMARDLQFSCATSSVDLHFGARAWVKHFLHQLVGGTEKTVFSRSIPREKRSRSSHVWMAAADIPFIPSNAARRDMASTSAQAPPPFKADLPSFTASSKSCPTKSTAVSIRGWTGRVRGQRGEGYRKSRVTFLLLFFKHCLLQSFVFANNFVQ